MSDSERLYKVVSDIIDDLLPDMLEENRRTLAQMITGILRGKNVQFRKIAQRLRLAPSFGPRIDENKVDTYRATKHIITHFGPDVKS